MTDPTSLTKFQGEQERREAGRADYPQRSLEGYVVLRLEDLKEAVHEVVREEGILGLAMKVASWDREYKGDEPWQEFRPLVVGLVRRNLVVRYGHLSQAPRAREVVNIYTHQQWHRAIDQHLIRNDPPGNDGHEFAAFQFGERGTWWLTFRPWLHCAIRKAGHRRRDAKRAIEETRRNYRAEEPEECGYCQLRHREGG